MDHPTSLLIPTCVRSSQSLGWSDGLEARKYLEPDTIDGWTDPVSPDVSLVVLTQGAMQMTYQRRRDPKTIHVPNGGLFLKPAGITPAQVGWTRLSPEPMQTLHLHLGADLLHRCVEELADRDPAAVTIYGIAGTEDLLLLQIARALQHELEHPSLLSRLYAETAAQMVAVHLLRHYTDRAVNIPQRDHALSQGQIQRVIAYVNDSLADDLSLATLADLVNFSSYHFARLFQHSTGETVHQFVLRHRLQHAQHLLANSTMIIAQIAAECGFSDQSHLTNAFRRRYGITPGAYREEYAK